MRTKQWLAPLALAAALTPVGAEAQTAITTDDMRALIPRSIGPAVTGGRIHDVESIPGDPSTILVGTASGGLWRTTNRGMTWTNVFDTMAVSTFGDIAISRSNPNVVYAGTGEQNNRQSSSYGNGVYRSDDGGETWRHLGLVETRHIGRIQVHPTNPDIAFVGALGNLWASSDTRGVYRTTDGGESWEQVLFVDSNTGAVDLQMDPSNPDVVFAAMYQRQRRAWGFNGGGPGSGIYKTVDGGSTWSELTNGIPTGDKGRIGLAIAESNPQVINALVEYGDRELTGTYRSEDGGLSWDRVSAMNGRPMYYSHIFIDPTDEDRVYALATQATVSNDGGRTWSQIALAPTYDVGIHADHHSIWIDPNDPEHLYLAGDAGLHESYDGGINFSRHNNFPISQFYAIGVDMRDPYWVHGGLQDNHSFMAPSETRRWAGILNDDWQQSGFGDGMYWQADPRDGRFAFGSSQSGNYFRYDTQTGDMQSISPAAPPGRPYRFDWTSPMMLSNHDPDVLYVAGNRLFRSPNQGGSWQSTEDLSANVDRDQLQIMGVFGSDITISRNDGTGSYGEAVTLDESPIDADVIWVGFDDGNLQLSRDGARTWAEVSDNVQGVPDGTYVSRIAASTTAAGTAYATFDAHRDGDFRPFVYRTEDFGETWTPLHGDLPEMGSVNVIVEHPDNPNVLFVGTEHHLFASTNRGESWAKMPNFPTTNYDDMVIHPREKDLVVGSHGRGVWILDDTRALAEWGESSGSVSVFSAGRGTIHTYNKNTSYRGQALYTGTNPVDGIEITYRLASDAGSATLSVTNERGETVREMNVPSMAGTHRVNWDLRHTIPGETDTWSRHDDPALERSIENRGFWVAPGEFTVTVSAGGSSGSTTVEVRGDPQMPMLTQAMYEDREAFMLATQTLIGDIRAFMQENGIAGGGRGRGGFGGRGAGPPTTPQARLQVATRTAQQVFQAMNGGGVRPGTLYPPTQTQRDQIQLARDMFDQAREEMR